MIYLMLAILGSALVSVGMRVSDRHVSNNMSILAVNYAACALMAAFYAGPGQLFPRTQGTGTALLLGAVGGLSYLAGFLLFQWNVSKNGVVLPATFMKLGVLVPTAVSILWFGEVPGIGQILGYLGALTAILLIHFEAESTRAGDRWALILLLLGGGAADAMSKVFEELGHPALKDQYLFYIFLTAGILCVVLLLVKGQRVGRAEVLCGLLVGIPNYFSSRFLLLSLGSVPAVVAYPTFSVGTIVLVSCAGALVFKERLSRRRIAAMGIILVSLALLNL